MWAFFLLKLLPFFFPDHICIYVVRLRSSMPREFLAIKLFGTSGYLTALIEAYPDALAGCISLFLDSSRVSAFNQTLVLLTQLSLISQKQK